MSITIQQPTPHSGASATTPEPVPDTGEQIPTLSWPTAAIFVAAVGVFGISTWAALTSRLPAVVTIMLSAAAIFVLFTVLHDASHYSISRHRWVNAAFGRAAMLFVSPLISFRSFAFIHIQHHLNTNDGDNDPDHFVTAGPRWQLPLRFPLMDVPYLRFLVRNIDTRPRSEILETAALITFSVAAVAVAGFSGHLWQLALVYLIPERIAVFVLAWWFDWLPHHDLTDTHRQNRYRATRNRVGAEWILTPLLLSQNYHLVHHLHPSIPFHRYVAAWRRNEAAYLEHNPALLTAFGQQLDAEQYQTWKELNGSLSRLLPVHAPRRTGETHTLVVRSVDPLTPDSVRISFDVPADLREQFRFRAGQHLTVHHRLDGQDIRRTYSICTSTGSGELAIAIRRIPDGLFSTFATERLRAGDTLELGPPTGDFCPPADPDIRGEYVAIAAGSGITPVLSAVTSILEIERDSRCTLIYGNRTTESTMFRAELEDLQCRFGDRLRVQHVRSADPADGVLTGRIDYPMVRSVIGSGVSAVDRWLLCGPQELVTHLRDNLTDGGVPIEKIHLELFHAHAAPRAPSDSIAAELTIGLRGATRTVSLNAGETLLEAALRNRIAAPYACMGGACGTCMATLTSGTVTMDQNFALSTEQVRTGHILTCQSRPTSATVGVDFDA
ncbi:fatty acid desaturase [Mycolicibacterium neoaurum]|uniref:fatty acid desaturase n=1 Tax=Mycolicibacterium neoaurum TaxID=1795 RepID=UPI0026714713|nr:fatty acid desaturase [Mycolicibacterium neoaurum]MDO3400323.1 fatty acid desaturase [Mycolicibacterium neoaurum]